MDGFPTPDEAALADFDPRYARVVEVTYSEDGTEATVDRLTNVEPTLYPYFVHCVRGEDGLWYETHSGN